MASSEEHKAKDKTYQAAYDYYKYIFDWRHLKDRHQRDLFWFDTTKLKTYKGLIIHLFSFEEGFYPFENGLIIKKPLRYIGFKSRDKRAYPNHLTEEKNIKLADNIYKLIKTMDSRL